MEPKGKEQKRRLPILSPLPRNPFNVSLLALDLDVSLQIPLGMILVSIWHNATTIQILKKASMLQYSFTTKYYSTGKNTRKKGFQILDNWDPCSIISSKEASCLPIDSVQSRIQCGLRAHSPW